MTAITLLTSSGTQPPSTSGRLNGQSAVATGSTKPALFITPNDSYHGTVCPALYSDTASGNWYQLVYRPTSKKLQLYYNGSAYDCYSGLQGITSNDTTCLGVLENNSSGYIGATLLGAKVPNGTSTSQSVGINATDTFFVPPTGTTMVGKVLSGTATTAFLPVTFDNYTVGPYSTFAGFKTSLGGTSSTTLTALGSFSFNSIGGESITSATHIGTIGSDARVAFGTGSTLISTGITGPSTGSRTVMQTTAMGMTRYIFGGTKSNSVSLGKGVTASSWNVVISVDWEVQNGRENDQNVLIRIYKPSLASEQSSGTRIGFTDTVTPSTYRNEVVTLGSGRAQRLVLNLNGAAAWTSVSNFGTAGQILSSRGSTQSPTWVSRPTYSFTSADGKYVTVDNGIITYISDPT